MDTAQQALSWCQQTINEKLAEALDKSESSAKETYQRLAQTGIIAELAHQHDIAGFAKLVEITSGYSGTLTNALAVNLACMTLLSVFGNQQQQQIAQEIAMGAASAAFLLTEENAGSDVPNLSTRAQRNNQGYWQIEGEKWFATGAQDADYLLVVARTDWQQAINQGTSIFCLAKTCQGITVKPMAKLASLGFASCYVSLNKVKAGADSLVGPENQAWGAMAFTGGIERILVAASCVGLGKTMLDYINSYCQNRQAGKQAIFEYQAISHQLVDISTKLKAAELLTQNAIKQLSRGGNASESICMAKLYASEVQQEISLTAMKLLGGRAYLKDFPIHRWQREGQLSLYAGGTNEIQKNLIARSLAKQLK